MTIFDFKKELPQAFPRLDSEQITAVACFAALRNYRDDDVLFRAGETDFMFHVVKTGAIEIVDRSSGEAQTILTHEPGEFTGDLANLTGRTSNVDAIVGGGPAGLAAAIPPVKPPFIYRATPAAFRC